MTDHGSGPPAWAVALRRERWQRQHRSVAWLAHELSRLAKRHGVVVASHDSLMRMIRRWENGERYPDVHYRWLLALALRVAEVDLFGGHDVAVSIPITPGSSSSRAVTAGDVEAIRAVTQTFRNLDNRLGGGYGLRMVSEYLRGGVLATVRDGHYNEAVGRQLFAAAAELAHLTAWMAYDMEDHERARQDLVRALQLATAAGDQAFAAEVLSAMSHHAIHLGEADSAIELARASQFGAVRADSPALSAEAHVLEAHGHALRADPRACAASLHSSELAFERADRAEPPAWLVYLDEAYLAARFGQCLRELGEWDDAERYARRSLDMNREFVRGQTFNTILLATTRVERDLEEACAIGTEAVELAAGLQSSRSVRYIRDLQARMRPYESEPSVQRFGDRVADLAAGVTG